MKYNGTKTKSCAYIFNPYTPVSELYEDWNLIGVHFLNTTNTQQLRISYNKSSFVNRIEKTSTLEKTYTIYYYGNKSAYINISYNILSNDYNEIMINLHRKGAAQVFLDNSAFNIERKHNKTWDKCPYPFNKSEI